MYQSLAESRAARNAPLTVVTALSIAAVAAFVVVLAATELSSVDLGYHLIYGRHVLDGRGIVDVDPFLYGAAGYRFVNANWAAQIVFAGIERGMGAVGLSVLQVGLIVATFVCVVGAARRAGAAWYWIPFVCLLAALAAYERFTLRPEWFSYLLLAAQLWLLLGFRDRPLLVAAALVVLQVAWVNLHSFFLVGPLVTAALGGGEIAGRYMHRRDESSAVPPRVWALWLALQLLACLANPWGVRGAIFPLQTLSFLSQQDVASGGPDGLPGNPWAAISEFHAPLNYLGFSICGRTISSYFAALIVGGLGVLTALFVRRFGYAAVILLLAAMSLRMRRNISPYVLGAMPLVAAAFTAWAARLPAGRTARVRAAAIVAIAPGLAALFWLPRALDGRFYSDERRPNRIFGTGWNDRVFPIAACNWINSQAALQPRVFADFNSSSGALLYLRPDIASVYVDTNTFAYPPIVLQTAQDVCLGKQSHRELFGRQRVNVVLLHADDATKTLIALLQNDPAWALGWYDDTFVVFIRRMAVHQAVLAAGPPTPASLDVTKWIARAERPHRQAGFELGLMAAVPLTLGWHQQTAALLQESVRREPGFLEAWFNLGYTHGMLANGLIRARAPQDDIINELDQVMKCSEKVLAGNPDEQLREAATLNLARAQRSLIGEHAP